MTFSVERSGHVATLWLDDAERRNAMGPAFWSGLPVVMEELSGDDGVRAVVVAARGPHFSVGLDLTTVAGELAAAPGASRAVEARHLVGLVRRLQAAVTAVADCAKPVVAAVHGACIGGGVDLVTACDIRLAAAGATFSVRETRLAMVADLGTLQRLPAIVGRGHVAELALTGGDVDAERAREIGLVNHVLPDVDALHAAAAALAGRIAANPPLAVQGTKAVLRATEAMSTAEALDYASVWSAAFLRSDDLVEAMAAFVEKRPPRFTGT